MKILFISKHYLPHIGGVEKHVQKISLKLKSRKLKVVVVCERIRNTKSHEILDGVEIFRIKYPKIKALGLLTIWWWLWKHRNLLINSNIIHCHDVFIWYLPFRFIFIDKSVYTTFHGWEGVFPISYKHKLIRQISAKLSWGNICVGKYIEKWYGIKADYITYGGVSINRVSKFIIPNSKFIILYLGRLDEDTGMEIYLDAFRIIKLKYPNVEFEFLGDGEFRVEAESVGRVLGFRKDITLYLKDCTFVCTSGYLSMLESLNLGKLVFAVSNNPIKLDVIEMSPFKKYVEHSKNANELARKIDYFLTNPKKANTIISNSRTWTALQTWDNLVKVYQKLWGI